MKNDPRLNVPDPLCGAVFPARRGACDPRALSCTFFDPPVRDNCRTQNEFIERAIRFYAGYVSGQEATAYLPPALASVLRGTVQDTPGLM